MNVECAFIKRDFLVRPVLFIVSFIYLHIVSNSLLRVYGNLTANIHDLAIHLKNYYEGV